MEGTPQKLKICRFYRVRSFSGSQSQGPCGYPGFPAAGGYRRPVGILSGRQQHEPRISPGGATKSSKLGDSLEGCGRCAQISSGRQQQEPRISPGGATKSSKFGDSLEDCGRCAQISSGRQQQEPRISPGGATKNSKFGDSLEDCAHPKGQID